MVKTLIALPILKNFTQHLVKIWLKLVLNSFSSLKLQNPRPGGGGAVYSHIKTVQVCAARKPPPPPPHFSDLATLLFRRRPLQKTPFSKIYNSLFCFSDLGRSKRSSFKKNIRFFVTFNSQIPCFSREWPLWKHHPPPPRIFSEGPLLKPPPPFLNKYIPISYLSTPHTHTHTHPGSKTIALKIVLAKCWI